MKKFNKNTSNFFYDLLTEEMGIIRNVQNDADFSINGVIDDEILEGGIAHELTHIFQNQNRTTPLLPNDKVKTAYRNSDKNINTQTGLFKYIGIVVYLTYYFEQDAYLNAAYNYILQKCGENNEFLYIYSQTEAYNSLHRMRNCLDLIEKALNDNDIKEKINQYCIKEYNISLEKIYKNGEKAYKRYARKLARMYGQAIKDVEKKQIKEGWLIHTREFYNPFKMELTELKKFDDTLKTLGF